MKKPWPDCYTRKKDLDAMEARLGSKYGIRAMRVRMVRDIVMGLKNVEETNSEYGASRSTLYRWLAVFRDGGAEALVEHGFGNTLRPHGAIWDGVCEWLVKTKGQPSAMRLRDLRTRWGQNVTRGTLYNWQVIADRRAAESKAPAPVREPAFVDDFA